MKLRCLTQKFRCWKTKKMERKIFRGFVEIYQYKYPEMYGCGLQFADLQCIACRANYRRCNCLIIRREKK